MRRRRIGETNQHVFRAFQTYDDCRLYRNAFNSVQRNSEHWDKAELLNSLREKYGNKPLPVQVDNISFTLKQLNVVQGTVDRWKKENKRADMETAWRQIREQFTTEAETETSQQPPRPTQQLVSEATRSSSRLLVVERPHDLMNRYELGNSLLPSSPVPSVPRWSSTDSCLFGGSSSSFACPGAQSPSCAVDVGAGWTPASGARLSPLSYQAHDTWQHALPLLCSPPLSPIDSLRTSDSNYNLPSPLPSSPVFHSPALQSSTTINPIPHPAARASTSHSNSQPHHHHPHIIHTPHASSPYSNDVSDYLCYPIDETSSTEGKEISFYSPTDSRAVKRPRPCSPLSRPQRPLSATYVAYSPYIRSLVNGHHDVFTAKTNVYFSSNNHVMANFYSNPSAICRTTLDGLNECLSRIGERTFTKQHFQCGTLSIIASGRPVDVERAMDGVRYLMEQVLPTLDDSNPTFVGCVEQYMCNREPYFSRFANLAFRNQEVSSQNTVFPAVPVPYEPEGPPSNRQSLSTSEWRPRSSQSSKGLAARNLFLEWQPPSSQLQDPTAQDITDLTHMTMMGQYSAEDLRREAVFSAKLEQCFSAQLVHSLTSERRCVNISPTVLRSRESDEDWDSFGSDHTDTNTYSACSDSSSPAQLSSYSLRSH